MVEWNVSLPAELDARLRSYLADHDDDLSLFVSQAIEARLAQVEDEDLQRRLRESLERGMADADAGRTMGALESMREIALAKGIKFSR